MAAQLSSAAGLRARRGTRVLWGLRACWDPAILPFLTWEVGRFNVIEWKAKPLVVGLARGVEGSVKGQVSSSPPSMPHACKMYRDASAAAALTCCMQSHI